MLAGGWWMEDILGDIGGAAGLLHIPSVFLLTGDFFVVVHTVCGGIIDCLYLSFCWVGGASFW